MPLGVTSCKAFIQEAYRDPDLTKTFFHGHSFTANPLACAAATASYDLLSSPEVIALQRALEHHLAGFHRELSCYEKVAHVRHQGCILALEWKSTDRTGYFNEARHHLYQWCLDRNVLLRPLGNVLYIIPPYCIKPASLEQVFDVVRELVR